MLSRRTGLSVRASRHQLARDDLSHLLSVASITDSPLIVEAVIVSLSLITRLCLALRVDLEALLLLDSSAPSPIDIKNFLSIACYAYCYLVACGDYITKMMWSEMKNEHYELNYLKGSFLVQNFIET